MIHLLYANTMDAFATALDAAITAERAAFGPWHPIQIIVPNPATAWFIEERLVRTQGIAANLELGFMDRLIRQFLPEGQALIDRPAIQGILLRRFQTLEGLADDVFMPIRRYLLDPPDPKRLAQLAYRLGGLMEEYLYSRPAWAAAWEKEDGTAGSSMEACQRALWRLLRQDLRESGRGWLTPAEACKVLTVPPELGPIHLFGMTHLAFGYHMLLDAIGRKAPGCLFFYALNPCREYWEDHPAGRDEGLAQARRGLAAFDLPVAGELTEEEDPYDLQGPGESIMLRRWGRAGREKIRVLNELADWTFAEAFRDPGQQTLLAALQQDILNRRTSDFTAGGPGLTDGSLQIHACPNPHREAETLCDLLWERFSRPRPASDPLRFADVAILVPGDQLDLYAAHLSAAFSEKPGIPLTVLARSGTALAQAVEAFQILLHLPDGQLSRADLLGFLDHPSIRRKLDDAYDEAWRTWCGDTGIIRGLDLADLQPTYFEGDLLSWDQGHRRLALGAFLAGDQPAFMQNGQDYPPRELGSGDWASAGTFILRTRALLKDLRALRQERQPLGAWVDRFTALAADWIGGEESEDKAATLKLGQALGRIRQLEPISVGEGVGSAVSRAPNKEGEGGVSGYPSTEPDAAGDADGRAHGRLPYRDRLLKAAPTGSADQGFECARELALQELQRLEVPRGSGRFQGVVLGDPGSLRGLPFKIVIMAGLGEGLFPAQDGVDDLDLRLRRRLPGDVPSSERDRYLFLEALLAAREQFIVSYVARQPISGDPLQPSPVVTELMEVVDEVLGPKASLALLRTHPLRRWDPRRFQGEGALLPAQASAYLEARAERRHRGPIDASGPELDPALGALPNWPTLIRNGARLRLRPTQIRDFLVSPLQGWAKSVLGLEQDEEDPDRYEEEAATTERGDATMLLREAFWAAHASGLPLPDAYRQSRRRLERAGTVPLGLFAELETRTHQATLAAWREQVLEGTDVTFPILGAARKASGLGPAPATLDLLSLTLAPAGGDPIDLELTGRLCPQGDLGQGLGSILLLNKKVNAASPPHRDLLLAWVDHLVLAAMAQGPRGHVAYLVGSAGADHAWAVPFQAVDPAQARRTLELILEDLLGQPHAHLLPITAAANLKEVVDAATLGAWLATQSEGEFGQISCKNGPVSDYLSYPPAGDAVLTAWRGLLQGFLEAIGGRS